MSAESTRRVRGPATWPWVAGFAAIAPIGAVYAWKSGATESGTWNCEVCGVTEERTLLLGAPIARESGAAPSGAYAVWWAAEIGVEHEHAWTPIGCHRSGGAISCTRRSGPLLECLDDAKTPTPELRWAALALARAEDGERRELIAELFSGLRCDPPEGAERVHDIASLRRRWPAWDRAIAVVELSPPR